MRQYVTKRNAVFLLAVCIYIFGYLQSITPATIATNLMSDIRISATELGVISSVYFLFYALIQPLIGVITDKFVPRKVLLISFFITLLGSILFTYADTLAMAILSRALIGIGTGGIFIPALKLLSEYYTAQETTRVSALFMGLGCIGGSFLATMPLTYFDGLFGWRKTLFYYAVVGVFIMISAVFVFRSKEQQAQTEKSVVDKDPINYKDIVKALLFSRNFIIIQVIFFTSIGVYLSFQGLWATKYLSEVIHVSPETAGGIIMCLPLGYFVGSLLAPYVSEKIYQSKMVAIQFGLIIMFLAWSSITFFCAAFTPLIISLFILVIGIATGIICPLIFASIDDNVPQKVIGLSLGITNLSSLLGVFVFQILTSMIVQNFSYGNVYTSQTFFIMMAFCMLTLFLIAAISLWLTDSIATKPTKSLSLLYCGIKTHHDSQFKMIKDKNIKIISALKNKSLKIKS